jgi:peptidyl-prolyl cis-trans isomerase B (cyclophilin B)
MRRLLLSLLACSALVLAACGDDEESAGAGGEGAETSAQTQQTDPEPTSGCEKVAEPKPKDVSKVKRRPARIDSSKAYTAVLKTSCGTIEIRLATGQSPKTSASFMGLARQDFYDGLAFHRIVPGFVVQGGDPEGTGEGGPGYEVVEAPPSDVAYTRGTVAMAKTELDEPGTSGSQFFLVTADDAGLPADYALLGKVSKGDDVLETLANVPNDPADNKPTEPVIIEDVTIRTAES